MPSGTYYVGPDPAWSLSGSGNTQSVTLDASSQVGATAEIYAEGAPHRVAVPGGTTIVAATATAVLAAPPISADGEITVNIVIWNSTDIVFTGTAVPMLAGSGPATYTLPSPVVLPAGDSYTLHWQLVNNDSISHALLAEPDSFLTFDWTQTRWTIGRTGWRG